MNTKSSCIFQQKHCQCYIEYLPQSNLAVFSIRSYISWPLHVSADIKVYWFQPRTWPKFCWLRAVSESCFQLVGTLKFSLNSTSEYWSLVNVVIGDYIEIEVSNQFGDQVCGLCKAYSKLERQILEIFDTRTLIRKNSHFHLIKELPRRLLLVNNNTCWHSTGTLRERSWITSPVTCYIFIRTG